MSSPDPTPQTPTRTTPITLFFAVFSILIVGVLGLTVAYAIQAFTNDSPPAWKRACVQSTEGTTMIGAPGASS